MAYPNYRCDVNYSVTNTGKMPINVTLLGTQSSSPGVDVSGDCAGGGGKTNQLAIGERQECHMSVEVTKPAEENATGTFHVQIDAIQWNKTLSLP